ncbi:MAG: dioxygenase family protein [Gemmobacter sp.]
MTDTAGHDHDHDRGLAFDLMILSRRRLLAGSGVLAIGASGLFALRGGPSGAEANVLGTAADGTTCVAGPAETAGPFPADGTNARAGQTVNVLTQSGVVRTDIRTSFAGQTAVADGLPMVIRLRLVDVGGACRPLAGHAVYVWHCDAAGRYSIYDTDDSNYLRGVGVTDADGVVQFTSIVPACYPGRWPHVHVEVFSSPEAAVSGEASLLISQVALPEAAMASVYATDARYAASVATLRGVTMARDMVFRDNTPEQIAAQTMAMTGDAAAGFTATATVGVQA